jgi:hypothetical protein
VVVFLFRLTSPSEEVSVLSRNLQQTRSSEKKWSTENLILDSRTRQNKILSPPIHLKGQEVKIDEGRVF